MRAEESEGSADSASWSRSWDAGSTNSIASATRLASLRPSGRRGTAFFDLAFATLILARKYEMSVEQVFSPRIAADRSRFLCGVLP